jgi:hypothetical protein
MSTTAQDIITGALRFINAYAPGESLSAADSADGLATLNDLLDSWSTDQASVYASDEDVFTFTAGQYRYTIGNYSAGTFAGVVTSGSPTITGVTVPTDMVIRGDVTGSGIPTGTTILAFNSGAGTVTMSANATATPGSQQIGYTIPGDFKNGSTVAHHECVHPHLHASLGARLPHHDRRPSALREHWLQGDLSAVAGGRLVQPDDAFGNAVLLSEPLKCRRAAFVRRLHPAEFLKSHQRDQPAARLRSCAQACARARSRA